MMSTSIILYTKPIPVNQKYVVRNGRNILSKKYRDAKEAIQWEVRSAWKGDTSKEEVTLNILQYFGDNRKRDIDAYLKILLDAMSGIVYDDDSQITEMHVYKEKDLDNPRIDVQVL